MATRDRSQGFGFVYVDIGKLLKEKEKLFESTPTSEPTVPSYNFNRDPKPNIPQANSTQAKPLSSPVASLDPLRERSQAIQQIRDNLDRLQNLHHKLHAMLNDLNQVSADKKRKN